MRSDFAALILTYKRPDKQRTLTALKGHGYTGKVYLVVDDEDPTLPEYRRLFGDLVVTFSKREYAEQCDECDNTGDRRSVLYARNASFDIARALGLRFFVQLDDDYGAFSWRFDGSGNYGYWRNDALDDLFAGICDYLAATPFASIALSQGGDHIGGGDASANHVVGSKRKAMNSFFCDVEKPFKFVGRLNDDVNTVLSVQRRGRPFLTLMAAQLVQSVTQKQDGGLTDLYLDAGTYIKSFYSVMVEPSAARVSVLRGSRKNDQQMHPRIHHKIDWTACAPCIVEERYRKPRSPANA